MQEGPREQERAAEERAGRGTLNKTLNIVIILFVIYVISRLNHYPFGITFFFETSREEDIRQFCENSCRVRLFELFLKRERRDRKRLNSHYHTHSAEENVRSLLYCIGHCVRSAFMR